MVRFQQHLAASREPGWEEFYVDFEKLKALAMSDNTDIEKFAILWKSELEKCSMQYQRIIRNATIALLRMCSRSPLARKVSANLPGLTKSVNRGYAASFHHGGHALRRYETTFEEYQMNEADELREKVLPLYEKASQFGLLNVEALRKAAKKLEKYGNNGTEGEEMSEQLFAQLTLSMIANGVSTDFVEKFRQILADCINTLSENDVTDAETDGANLFKITRRDQEEKISEFDRVEGMVANLDENVRKALVSHRGFHSRKDSTNRPLENTLTAYEQAWAMGLHYCECDISLTIDQKIVLCHDDHLQRLARDPNHSFAYKPITMLTYDELCRLRLKNGTRAPLLKEVLRCAARSGTDKGLVVEIKAGADGNAVAANLCELFVQEPELLAIVAVVMSFDLYIIRNFANFFQSVYPRGNRPEKVPKMMFLTKNVEEEPDHVDVEMSIDWDHHSAEEILSQLREYMCTSQGECPLLDGIYMQYHPSMVDPNSATGRLLREMTASFTVGIWGSKADPDSLVTASKLIDLGISFVNTDLPKNFAKLSGEARHRKNTSISSTKSTTSTQTND